MSIFRIIKPPQTLDELSASMALWDKLHNDQPEIEAKFSPLYEQFNIMEKYEVSIPEDITVMLNELSNEWVAFQQTLLDADVMIKKHKVTLDLKWGTRNSIDGDT